MCTYWDKYIGILKYSYYPKPLHIYWKQKKKKKEKSTQKYFFFFLGGGGEKKKKKNTNDVQDEKPMVNVDIYITLN